MRRFGHRVVAVTAVVMACLWAFAAAGAQAQVGGAARARLLEDGGVPARLDPGRCAGDPGAGRRQQLSRSTRPRMPAAFTAENLARYDAVVWLSTTGDVLDAAQQAAFEALHPGGRRLRRRARGQRHRVHVELVRRPRRRVLRQPPREPDGDGRGRRPRAPVDEAPAGALVALRRVVRLPDQPARQGPRARHAGRDHLRARRLRDGHRPPDRLVPLLPGRPLVVHGHGPHRRGLPASRRSASTCSAASCGRPARSPTTAAARSGTTSRRPCSTTTSRARWASTSRRTAACSTSSAPARCASSTR